MVPVLLMVVLVAVGVIAGWGSTRIRRKLDPEARRVRMTMLATSAGSLALAGVIGVSQSVVVIPPGSVGVAIVLGKVVKEPLGDGLHLLPPWYNLEVLNARTQSYTMSHVHDEGAKTGDDSISVLTSNGMEMKLDVTVTYRLLPDAAPWVFRNLGDKYEDSPDPPRDRHRDPRGGLAVLRRGGLRGQAREAGRRHAHPAGTLAGEDHPGRLPDAPAKVFSVSNVLVRNIELPKTVTEGINRKLVMRQESERMEFQIERDKKEAERKVIEAKGIQDSQAIIAKGITPDYLTWKSIEATEMLARSPNAKIIVIGNTRNGLPIMLDQSVPPSPGALTPEERDGGHRAGATSGTNNVR